MKCQRHRPVLPPSGLFEFIAVTAFGLLPGTSICDQYVQIFTDYCLKVTLEIAILVALMSYLVTIICLEWIVPYGNTSHFYTDNGPQFVPKILEKQLHFDTPPHALQPHLFQRKMTAKSDVDGSPKTA